MGFVVRVVAVPLRRGLGVGVTVDVLLRLGAVVVALLGLALVNLVLLLLRMLRPLNLMRLLYASSLNSVKGSNSSGTYRRCRWFTETNLCARCAVDGLSVAMKSRMREAKAVVAAKAQQLPH